MILGHPPDPTAFLAGRLTWALTSFTQELLDALGPTGLWVANLTKAVAVPVLTLTKDTKNLVATYSPLGTVGWELDDSYALQHQEDLWHFSKIAAVKEVIDPDDWCFGWVETSQWGVILRPADKGIAYIEEKLGSIGINRQTPGVDLDSPTQKLDYDVQTDTRTGAVVAVRPYGDKICPWGTSDNRPPLAITRQQLLHVDAAATVGKSQAGGSDGFKPRLSGLEAVSG